MPGLLQSEGSSRSRFAAAVAAEFVGSFLFALIGAAAPLKNAQNAWANGIAYAVLIYATANVSGGHINPAVTMATLTTGHIALSRALAYMAAQVLGAAAASAMHMVLVPKAARVGCFGPGGGATLGQAFGWEVLMTMALVLVIYAVAVGESSFGPAAPAAIGLTLGCCALTATQYSGASLNPARTLGPALVFGGCGGWGRQWAYVFAELLGAVGAAVASWPLYGTGLQFGKWWDAVEGAVHNAVDDAKETLRGGYARLEEGGGGQ